MEEAPLFRVDLNEESLRAAIWEALPDDTEMDGITKRSCRVGMCAPLGYPEDGEKDLAAAIKESGLKEAFGELVQERMDELEQVQFPESGIPLTQTQPEGPMEGTPAKSFMTGTNDPDTPGACVFLLRACKKSKRDPPPLHTLLLCPMHAAHTHVSALLFSRGRGCCRSGPLEGQGLDAAGIRGALVLFGGGVEEG